MIRVLFVCTGNICRSPTAEGVFRHLVETAGLAAAFEIDSAGTDAYHAGDPPDARAIKTARDNGVEIADQRARQVTVADFDNYEYIFAMDRGHLTALQSLAPAGSLAHITLFMAAAEDAAPDVPDPWYGGEDAFRQVYAMIEKGARAILDNIRGTFEI